MIVEFLKCLPSRGWKLSPFVTGVGLLIGIPMGGRAQSQDLSTPYSFALLAGAVSSGSADGPIAAARFYFPEGIAVDTAGNLYVADTGNTSIRKISSTGLVTTLAGKAAAPFVPYANLDGTGRAARLIDPVSVAVNSSGVLFVADGAGNAIRRITPEGVVTTPIGNLYGSELNNPGGVAMDGSGNIYIADTYGNTIRRVNAAGGSAVLVAGGTAGGADGTGTAAQFYNPRGIAVAPTGEIYVADTGNHTIRKISPTGTVTTLAGLAGTFGSADNSGASARFYAPTGLVIDVAGNLYVADAGNDTIRKITPAGVVTTLAGRAGQSGHVDGLAAGALFNAPRGLAIDMVGNIFVADTGNEVIRKITPGGTVSTVAGFSPSEARGNIDGPKTMARFNFPNGICRGPDGSMLVADGLNSSVRQITADGVVTTYARGDGKFTQPFCLTMSPSGVVYVADVANIWRIATDGTVSLFFNQVHEPTGCAVDSAGNLIVADNHNFVVRKIAPDGSGTILAGASGQPGYQNGTGSAARFAYMGNLAVDGSDNIFLADFGNNTIRKITPAGVVSTLAGTQESGWKDGAGDQARFQGPLGLTLDAAGNIFVTDGARGDARGTIVRRITPAGVVSSLAGGSGYSAIMDGVGLDAHFDGLCGIAVDSSGAVYVTCSSVGAAAICKGRVAGAPVISSQPASQAVVTGGNVQLSVTAAGEPAPTYQWYFNGAVMSGATTNTLGLANARSSDAGDYTVVVTNVLGSVTSSKATLTVSAATTPSSPGQDSSGGGGGGGAIPAWFVSALLMFGAAYVQQRKSNAGSAGNVE